MNEQTGTISRTAPDPFAPLHFNWEEFKNFVSSDLIKNSNPIGSLPGPRYLFRGHRNEEWILEPSFDRTFKTIPDEDRKVAQEMLIANFMIECQDFPQYDADLRDPKRRIALAQHYGLPTRLLDWTESPYIAAFFAFQNHLSTDHGQNNSGQDAKVAIWIIDRRAPNYWDGEHGVELLNPMSWADAAPSLNARCKRQLGWFTLARMPFKSLQEYVLHSGNRNSALRKVTMSAGLAKAALRDLELMRINARELYADLSGAVASAMMRSVLSDTYTPGTMWNTPANAR